MQVRIFRTAQVIVGSFAAIVTVRSVAKLLKSYYSWLTTPLRHMPSAPGNRNFVFGSFLEIFKEAFMEPHKRWLNQFGWEKSTLIYYTTLFGSPNVLVMDCDIVKEVLSAPSSSNDSRFPKKLLVLRHTIGDGLVTLDGADWSRHRRIIQPSFQVSVLRDALNERVWPAVSVLVDAWKRAPGREIDVSSHLSAVTLDVIGHVAFLYDFQALDVVTKWSHDADQSELGAVEDPLVVAFNQQLKQNPLRLVLTFFGLAAVYDLMSSDVQTLQRLLNEAVDKVIADNRKRHTAADPKSLLQLLLNAKDGEDGNKTLSDVELRDEAKTFLLAGHETTATWCYWACYALAKHPDIQERVYREIAAACPSGPVRVEAADKMEYLNAFLQEVLRLYPPVGIISRNTIREESIGGFRVPAGTRLSISPHLLHRHPQYWPDAESFLPERWLQPSEISGGRSHYFAFVPFSAGGRNCIGQRFATMEALLVMAPLIRAFEIELAPSQRETDFRFSNFVTMKAKPALKICVKSRE